MSARSIIAYSVGQLQLTLAGMILLASSQAFCDTAQIDSLLRIFNNIENSQGERVSAALNLGRHYLQIDLEQTGEFARFARRNLVVEDSNFITALDLTAKHHFFSGNLDSAAYYFKTASDIALQRGDSSTFSKLGISLGSVLLRKTRYEDAINTLLSSANYFESRGEAMEAAKCYSNVSTAYANLENFDQAIKYSEKALQTFRSLNEMRYISITLPNLATQYLKRGDTIPALRLFKEATNIGEKNDDLRSLAIIYNNLGTLYLDRNELKVARQYFQKSLQAKKESNITKDLENIYYNLGIIYSKEGNHQAALEQYGRALSTPTPLTKVSVFQKLKETYFALGDPGKALQYADSSYMLADSLYQIANAETFAEISAKYAQAQNENEILRLSTEKQQLENNRNKNRFAVYSLTTALLAIILVTFLILKNQRKKRLIEKQEHQLEQESMLKKLRDQELTTMDQIIESQEQQRNEISADIHDGLGSKMATLRLQLDQIMEVVGPRHKPALERALELADLTYAEARDLSHHLNAGMAKDGLEPALRRMANYINSADSATITIASYDLEKRLENSVEIQLFRIVQELVTNALKHADASDIVIQLVGHEDSINVSVEDNGKGFNIERYSPGIGLENVKHRISSLGGTFDIDSGSEGTNVLIVVPI